MVHHPGADRFVIAGEICLRHRLAVVGVRPERLVGVGDQNADDIFFATFAEGLGLSFWSGKCPRPVDLTSRRADEPYLAALATRCPAFWVAFTVLAVSLPIPRMVLPQDERVIARVSVAIIAQAIFMERPRFRRSHAITVRGL